MSGLSPRSVCTVISFNFIYLAINVKPALRLRHVSQFELSIIFQMVIDTNPAVAAWPLNNCSQIAYLSLELLISFLEVVLIDDFPRIYPLPVLSQLDLSLISELFEGRAVQTSSVINPEGGTEQQLVLISSS
ncbi:MAG: hypothetical protein EZS28_033955 [Streblomastix strix]|uniref:Uncharacterized protein n=1 Tax=Streblomastix strix TaxID=222440 RepID=A0A5J4UIX1_9EUKA|nr:MAG: hypothetical protein EZS28_033955 [Streblomastix strix]